MKKGMKKREIYPKPCLASVNRGKPWVSPEKKED
jgi:hypothetical protein